MVTSHPWSSDAGRCTSMLGTASTKAQHHQIKMAQGQESGSQYVTYRINIHRIDMPMLQNQVAMPIQGLLMRNSYFCT